MISKREVEHIAALARLALTLAEAEKFQKELSGILAFVEELGAVDTASGEPLYGGTELENVIRKDVQTSENAVLEGYAEELIRAAPERRERWIKVQSIFG